MRVAIVQSDFDVDRSFDDIDDSGTEADVDTGRACSGEKNLDEQASAERDARSTERASMVALIDERQAIALRPENFYTGRIDSCREDLFQAADRSQSIGAIGREGKECPFGGKTLVISGLKEGALDALCTELYGSCQAGDARTADGDRARPGEKACTHARAPRYT